MTTLTQAAVMTTDRHEVPALTEIRDLLAARADLDRQVIAAMDRLTEAADRQTASCATTTWQAGWDDCLSVMGVSLPDLTDGP